MGAGQGDVIIRTCACACTETSGFGARPASCLDIYRPSARLPSGNSSATSRALSRRLHHTYAAEHYITENDEPGVQSPRIFDVRHAESAACIGTTADRRSIPGTPEIEAVTFLSCRAVVLQFYAMRFPNCWYIVNRCIRNWSNVRPYEILIFITSDGMERVCLMK